MVRCADFAAGRGDGPFEARSGKQICREMGTLPGIYRGYRV